MKLKVYKDKVRTLNMNILSIKEDLKLIKTPCLQRYAESLIDTMEANLHILLKKFKEGKVI
jgi:hypothetical protein